MTRFVCYLRKGSIIVCYLQSDDVRGDRDKSTWDVWIAADTGEGVYKVVWEIKLVIKGGIVTIVDGRALFARCNR
jgi:hypothetical protein